MGIFLIKRIFIINIILLITSIDIYSQNHNDLVNKINNKLSESTNIKDSIKQYYNLLDVYSSVISSNSSINKLNTYRQIYELAEKIDDNDIKLDMIRLIAMTPRLEKRDSIYQKCRNGLKTIPNIPKYYNSIKEAELIINISEISNDFRFANPEEASKMLDNAINDYKKSSSNDLYEQINKLFSLCICLENLSTQDIYVNYMDDLSSLIEQLPENDNYAFVNLFYNRAAIIFANNNNHQRSIDADKKTIENIKKLEEKYNNEGRIYREFSRFYFACYRRILSNYKALTPKEVDSYYKKVQDIKMTNAYVNASENHNKRCTIYYLMSKKEYEKALEILLKNKNTSNEKFVKRQLLDFIIECADSTGNQKVKDEFLAEYNKNITDIKDQRLQEKFRELQLLYDIDRLNNEVISIELERSKNRLNFILVFVSIVSISLIIALISIIALTKKNKNISKLSYTLQASEKDLIIALAEAEKANKTKTTFLRSMSHEIRTPLNAVLGFSEVLLNSIPNNEENLETKEYIQAINKCADSLLIMANDIVNLVKLEDGKYTLQISEVNLNSLCSKLYLEAKSKVNENVNILYDFQLQNNYTIKTDINRVEQILTNILSNAIKFTNEGLITFTCLESSDGKWIEFYIADTGIGIPDDKSEIIFGRFEKLDQFTQGTGLGLYLCRVLSETLNGKVTLDKSYKTGARFIFRLPR